MPLLADDTVQNTSSYLYISQSASNLAHSSHMNSSYASFERPSSYSINWDDSLAPRQSMVIRAHIVQYDTYRTPSLLETDTGN